LSPQVKDEAASGQALVRAAGLISGFTLLSRVLGLVREQVFAALLGASLYADAFNIAFRIPNLLRDLFAEGALSAAFVPTYAAAVAREGRGAAHCLANRVFSLLAVLLGAVVVLGILGAPLIVWALAGGFAEIEGKTDLTVLLTRVMMPFLPLVSFAAVAMGMLNAERRFRAPAFAPAMFNVLSIGIGIALWLLGWPAERVVLGWSVGTLLGGLAQFLVQVPSLRRDGFRFSWDWLPGDPGIRRIAMLMAPATVGLAAVQINIFISSTFASEEPGAVSWLLYAFRILYLPIGLFGVALGTVAATGLARTAARGDTSGLQQTLRHSLRMLMFLTIPASAGLAVLAAPIVRLLYERGQFGPQDTHSTAVALAVYGIGLVGYTGVKVVAPAFYALDAPRTPLVGSAAAVATNLVVILLLHDRLGFRAIALGTALGALVNVGILLSAFEGRVGGLRGQGLVRAFARMAVAAALMAAVSAAAAFALEEAVGDAGLAARLVTGLAPVAIGVPVYLGLARVLGIVEVETLFQALRRRA
jgi:putative peptidoglycan lipid II flippase